MATIFPGSPPTFNKNDVSGTVKSLCNYTRSMQENLDFLLGQMKKNMEETNKTVSSQGEAIKSLQNALASVQNSLSTLSSNYNSLAARVAALEQKIT